LFVKKVAFLPRGRKSALPELIFHHRSEASTNLIDWTTVMEAVVLKDLRFIELNTGESHRRFYRARKIL